MVAVSVVIPAYNASATILDTIRSIQEQTFSDWEIIVINDGSTDKTVEVVHSVEDSRIKVFSYENGGLPVARNRGISRATGEFISFVDADDLWTPDKLESQVTALREKPEAGVAYSWTAFVNKEGKFLYAWRPIYFEGNVYPRLLVENFISSGSNILVRRKYIQAAGEFDASLKSAEDWDYYIRLAALCPFVVVPKYQILYRQSSQSMTAKVDVMENANLIVINRAFEKVPEELKPLKNHSLSNTYRYLTKLCIAHTYDDKNIGIAFKNIQKSIKLYPKTLLDRDTQRLIIKLILMRLLPQEFSLRFIKLFAKVFPMVSVQNTELNKL